jgi:MFS family permease
VLSFAVLDLGLEQGIVGPALPVLERHYGASPTAGTWILTGFVLAAAVAIPLAGRLGDQFGRRRMLSWSLALFALGSLICAVSGSIGPVIAGRVVQGLGAGLAPLALALARDHLPAERLTAAVGVLVAAGSVGAVVGLLLAGLLVDHVSVPAIFWVLFAAAAALVALVHAAVPESPHRTHVAVDLLGAGLLAGALSSLTVAISQGNRWGWGSSATLLLIALSLALGAAFVVRERTAAAPLLDPRALALRSIWSANLAICALGFSLLIALALVPLLAAYPKLTGYGLGLRTTQIGLVLVPSALATLIAGPVGGRLVPRTGARLQIVCGTLLTTISYAALALVSPSPAALTLALIPLGIGIGLALGAVSDLVALASPPAQTAGILGLNTVIRTVSSALGAQVAIAVVTATRLSPLLRIPAHSGFTHAFWMAAAASLVALAAVALTPARDADPAVVPENK